VVSPSADRRTHAGTGVGQGLSSPGSPSLARMAAHGSAYRPGVFR
jgi:hypothetical protein